MGSPRLAYSWILPISGLSATPMILWQPTQRSTDGRPAYSERRASAWQYWQGIWNEPAWTTWLKKIGCFGARGGRASVVGPPRYSGRASVRTKATIRRTWSALSVRSKGGIVGASPCAGPPWVITLTRNSSGSPFMRRPSARSAGRVAKPAADAPSPRPPSPWQVAQWVAKSARPAWTSRSASGPASARDPKTASQPMRMASPSAAPPAAQLRHPTPAPPPRPLFADQAEPALQVCVTDGAVHVDHALFEAL